MNCDQEHHWQLWQGLRAGVLWKNAKRLSFWGPRGPLVLPLIGPPSACPQEFLLLLLLLQMIICKRPVPLDDHFKEAGPFGWSFVRGRPLPMIICRRLAVLDDHLQEAGPFGWSFARGVRSTLSTPSPLSPYHLCQDPDSISRTFLEQFVLVYLRSSKLLFSGPQDDPEDCGLPILCIFYCLILFILSLSIYTTIKGTRE